MKVLGRKQQKNGKMGKIKIHPTGGDVLGSLSWRKDVRLLAGLVGVSEGGKVE
jgi:hypothetical protein